LERARRRGAGWNMGQDAGLQEALLPFVFAQRPRLGLRLVSALPQQAHGFGDGLVFGGKVAFAHLGPDVALQVFRQMDGHGANPPLWSGLSRAEYSPAGGGEGPRF